MTEISLLSLSKMPTDLKFIIILFSKSLLNTNLLQTITLALAINRSANRNCNSNHKSKLHSTQCCFTEPVLLHYFIRIILC